MIDRLTERIEALGCPVVVGLDPTLEMLPEKLLADAVRSYGETPEAVAFAFLKFNKQVIDATCDVVPAVKPQIAMYERYGLDGLRAYQMTCAYAAGRGLVVIGDVKRGDIGSTAAAYAAHIQPQALFGRAFDIWREDAITVNPYMGGDSVEPYLEVLRGADKGIFVLVKTSNPGGADVQDLRVQAAAGAAGAAADAGAGEAAGGAPLYEHVARLVSGWGADLVGTCGYSKVGAVVGATHPEAGARLRALMPRTFFLVPGYGAQGATAADVARFFDKDGRGCIVNSSRGITAAWKKDGGGEASVGKAARAAAIQMRDEIAGALGWRT
ncbi:MAG: orotidine-5'-phosphate decarboxylase [Clostridiales Family XIII bacterium]|nr:orotidine-5'-phosphate decarboxylase [Clostridiales Family XIII bacterium]